MHSLKAHLRYAGYLLRHKWYVFLACRRLGVPLWQALVHDWTKLLPSEWFPYVRFFYGLPRVGDVVEVTRPEGGGPARVVEQRRDPASRYRVQMLDGSRPGAFWAPDSEVAGLDEAKAAFEAAWGLHQKRNRHHWQFWLSAPAGGEPTPTPMPERYVREMVADWVGAGRAITGRVEVAEWYARNRERMQLAPATRDQVERLLAEHFPAEKP
jgi:hypothetical protein